MPLLARNNKKKNRTVLATDLKSTEDLLWGLPAAGREACRMAPTISLDYNPKSREKMYRTRLASFPSTSMS